MRNILDKVHRELSVTKRMMTERELQEASASEEEEDWVGIRRRRSSSLRGGEGSIHDSKQEQNNNENLRGNRQLLTGGDGHPGRRLMTGEDYEGLAGDHYSFVLDLSDTMDQALPILENENSTSNDNMTAIDDKNDILISNSGGHHQLDIGAWLLMVLVVGFAVLGIVTYRSSPRRKRRRAASYEYKGVSLPTLNEDDWGAE